MTAFEMEVIQVPWMVTVYNFIISSVQFIITNFLMHCENPYFSLDIFFLSEAVTCYRCEVQQTPERHLEAVKGR